MRADGWELWEACQLKESLPVIFAKELHNNDVMDMIAQWCDAAGHSGQGSFMKAAASMRVHKHGIYETVTRKPSRGASTKG